MSRSIGKPTFDDLLKIKINDPTNFGSSVKTVIIYYLDSILYFSNVNIDILNVNIKTF